MYTVESHAHVGLFISGHVTAMRVGASRAPAPVRLRHARK